MDEGKQVHAQQYNRGARVLPRLEQSQKLWCIWIQARMYGLQHKLYSAQLERADHIVSRLDMEESIPGTGDS